MSAIIVNKDCVAIYQSLEDELYHVTTTDECDEDGPEFFFLFNKRTARQKTAAQHMRMIDRFLKKQHLYLNVLSVCRGRHDMTADVTKDFRPFYPPMLQEAC
jgi:hypothetical protein